MNPADDEQIAQWETQSVQMKYCFIVVILREKSSRSTSTFKIFLWMQIYFCSFLPFVSTKSSEYHQREFVVLSVEVIKWYFHSDAKIEVLSLVIKFDLFCYLPSSHSLDFFSSSCFASFAKWCTIDGCMQFFFVFNMFILKLGDCFWCIQLFKWFI